MEESRGSISEFERLYNEFTNLASDNKRLAANVIPKRRDYCREVEEAFDKIATILSNAVNEIGGPDEMDLENIKPFQQRLFQMKSEAVGHAWLIINEKREEQ